MPNKTIFLIWLGFILSFICCGYWLSESIENLIANYKQQQQDEQLAKVWGDIHEDAPAPLLHYYPPSE